ncbi:hypothetical protein Hdeb2414_s0003g00115821 [Helianthus debilis subsp. tardiflorus]
MISRLYRMKQKSRTLQLKVAVDDKIFDREKGERGERGKREKQMGIERERERECKVWWRRRDGFRHNAVANREGNPSLGLGFLND